MREIPSEWIEQMDALLGALESGPENAADEERLVEQLAAMDPHLLAFLIEQIAAQETPQAAALLELLAGHAQTPEPARAQAREGLRALAAHGVTAPAPGEPGFTAGFIQQARERGEQIMLLCWRQPDASLEAFVFLLDWRGDGLKDFYRTRSMTPDEWDQLVAHNADKGAPLVPLTLAEARAQLEAVLAESRRFSRPLPREYRLEQRAVEQRILEPSLPPPAARSFVTPDLEPAQVVAAYVAALHHRDYRLAAELLVPEQPARAGRSIVEAAAALQAELKHAPRRAEDVRTVATVRGAGESEQAEEASVEAHGTEVLVDRNGRRTQSPVHERYTLRRSEAQWRIAAIVRLTNELSYSP
jgi:hypothetical protein